MKTLKGHIDRSTLIVGTLLIAAVAYWSGAGLSTTWFSGTSTAQDIGTAFTYQGQLADEGSPVTGGADLTFSLWDAAIDGNQVGPTLDFFDVGVDRGLFAVELDFGDDAFGGGARWTQIQARTPSGSGDYELLDPRQRVNPVPYAISGGGGGVATTLDIDFYYTDAPPHVSTWAITIPADGFLTIAGSGRCYAGGGDEDKLLEVRVDGSLVAIAMNFAQGRDSWHVRTTIDMTAGDHLLEVSVSDANAGWQSARGGITLTFHRSELIATEQP